uniref:Uncharacterized protein n=1 Tax=Anguilla anguilla TaxID=7936 RepID=A0A0E9Q4Q0_ANGAN
MLLQLQTLQSTYARVGRRSLQHGAKTHF